MSVIEVNGLRLYGYHGCHPQERVVGGVFEVNISVEYDFFEAANTDDLTKTIDYVALMQIAKEEMAMPKDLIETVAHNIASRIKTAHPESGEVVVQIVKPSAPVSFDLNHVSVRAILS